MGACTMGTLTALPFVMARRSLARCAVANLWCRTDADAKKSVRGISLSVLLERSSRRAAELPRRARSLSREVRGMPRGDGNRGHVAHVEKQRRPNPTSRRAGESCRFARRTRRRSGITSIARCLSIARGR